MTSLSLYKTYIQPVLTYGLEIVQPKQSLASCFSIALSGCLHILLNRVMHLMSIITSIGSSPDRI
jgi:hypothetical protein